MLARVLAAVLLAAALLYAPGVLDPERIGRETYGCDGVDAVPEAGNAEEVEAATLCLLNAARREAGLAPLREEPALAAAAEGHARDMARRGFFAHESPEGRKPHQRIRRGGYSRRALVGENLAFGDERAGSPFEIFDGWMNSPGHRRNILRRAFEEIGIGIARDARRAYYVTTFGAE